MTDAVVKVFVGHLFNALLIDGQFVANFQKEFRIMLAQLDITQSLLTDLERDRANKSVKVILGELREMIYDADDILVDCQIQGDYRIDAPYCYKLSPCEIVFTYLTRRKLKEINERLWAIQESLKTHLSPIISQILLLHSSNRAMRWTSPYCDPSAEIVGLREDTRKITQWLVDKNETSNLIGIVGMAGLGKTTIAQKLFNDIAVINHFDKLIWVPVSQTPSEIPERILSQLGTYERGYGRDWLLNRIHETLRDSCYLIVFDDVWLCSTDDGWWDDISSCLPRGAQGSCSIIITTRNEEVLRRMGVEGKRIHRPKLLDSDESWSLFCNIIFPKTNYTNDSMLEKVEKEMVEKCGGLPLAIKTVGALLSAKTYSLRELKRLCENFQNEIAEGMGISSSLLASLKLSYDELSAHLKGCLLCFSVYPENYEISTEHLIYWWIGEGFVVGKNSRGSIETAFDCLSELISRCLVEAVSQWGYDGRVYSCKVHETVRNLTIQIAGEGEFINFNDTGRQTLDSHTRRSSITSETVMNLQKIKGNSKLRALPLVTKLNYPLRYSNSGLAGVNSLRVLDLSHNVLDDIHIDDLAWISSQKRLAYLNLKGVSSLKELPYSFRKLRNLRILVLAQCNNLKRLPQFITFLQRLIILDTENCPSLQYLPKGLCKLHNLERLFGFKLASSSNTDGCGLGELIGLTKLRELKMEIEDEDEISEEELHVLSKLEQLQVLSINTEKCRREEILQKLDKLSPPPNLQQLYLIHYNGETTPKWINPESLLDLKYLSIENGNLIQMNTGFWGRERKWNIEGLCFKYLPALQLNWVMVQNAMPILKYFEASHCHCFESFPSNVENFGSWRKTDEYKRE